MPRADDPFEDDGTGYIDPNPGLLIGGIETRPHPYELTEAEAKKLAKRDKQARKRRIRPGFWLPGETE